MTSRDSLLAGTEIQMFALRCSAIRDRSDTIHSHAAKVIARLHECDARADDQHFLTPCQQG